LSAGNNTLSPAHVGDPTTTLLVAVGTWGVPPAAV
jgi:hypothetical protein